MSSEIKHTEHRRQKIRRLDFLGAGLLGDDIGSALSEAFNESFEDPIEELIGYKRQGPYNGPCLRGRGAVSRQ